MRSTHFAFFSVIVCSKSPPLSCTICSLFQPPAMLQPRQARLVLTVQLQPWLCRRLSASRAAQPCRLRAFRRLVPRATDEQQCCHDEQQADGSPRSPHQTSQIVTYAHPDAQRRRREHQQRCGTCQPALQKARNGPTFMGGHRPMRSPWAGVAFRNSGNVCCNCLGP